MKSNKSTIAIYVDKDLVNLYKASLVMYEALRGISGWLVTSRNGRMPKMDSAINAVRQALALAEGRK